MKVLGAFFLASLSVFADGKIFHLTGKATVVLSGKKGNAKLRTVIRIGDQVSVEPGARVGVQFADGASVLLTGGTQFTYQNPGAYLQASGESSLIFKRTASSPKEWQVRTPTVTAAVRGTGFTLGVNGKKTRVALFEGKLIVKDFIREAGMSSDPNGMMLDFLADVDISAGQVIDYDGEAVTKSTLDPEKEPTASLRSEHENLLKSSAQ